MKIEQLKPLEKLPYFTISGFKQALNAKEGDNQRIRDMLWRWAKKGHIIRLKRGIYMTRRFYELHQNHASFRPAVSAILLPQSYISLEYVLQQEGILTDVTYPITSVTLKNTKTIDNSVGTFIYRHVKPQLYTGFRQESFYGMIFNQSSAAKALFDYFYLRPLSRSLYTHKINLTEELRLNLGELSSKTKNEFEEYIEMSDSPKMMFIYQNLRKTIWQP